MDNGIKTTLIDDLAGWDSCRDEWERLLDVSRPSHPFLLWTWIRLWAQRMSEEGNSPFLLVVSKGGKTLAMIPLQVRRSGLLRVLEGLAQEFCDYIDWPHIPGVEKEVCQAFLGWMKEFSGRYDYIRIFNLFPSGFAHVVLSGVSSGLMEKHSTAPQIATTGRFEDYVKSLNPKLHHDIKRRERKLIKDKGALEYSVISDNDKLPEIIDIVSGWMGSRLKAQGKSSYLDRKGMKEHFVRLYGELNDMNLLDLSVFKIQGRLAAINVAFKYEGGLFSYTTVFDPDLSQYSIIRIIKLKHLEQCFADGTRVYDFCLGAEKHKLDFQPEMKQLYSFTRYNSNLKGSMKKIFDSKLKPALKKSKLAHDIKEKYFKQS